MARPDLTNSYDGWQALDPTPQEKSEGTTCTARVLCPTLDPQGLPPPRPCLAPAGAKPWVVTVALAPAGVFCCGPAPVRAIKEGDLQLKYDIPFVFAEVNADVVYWVVRNDGTHKKSTHSSIVGKNISTKSVGRDSREDITHNYKYPEGTGGAGAEMPRGGGCWETEQGND